MTYFNGELEKLKQSGEARLATLDIIQTRINTLEDLFKKYGLPGCCVSDGVFVILEWDESRIIYKHTEFGMRKNFIECSAQQRIDSSPLLNDLLIEGTEKIQNGSKIG